MSYHLVIFRGRRQWFFASVVALATIGCSAGLTEPHGPTGVGPSDNSTVLEPGGSGTGGEGTTQGDSVGDPLDGIPQHDDLDDPGSPAVKKSYLFGLEEAQGPPDHFGFDRVTHWVRTSSIHGSEFVVAIDWSVLDAAEGLSADRFADYAEKCFHASWHVFGGFAYDRFAVRVRADDENAGFSLSDVGITIGAADYAAPWGLEVVAHEMFHSWNGKFIRPEPDSSDNLFQWETWIVEGATVYYSLRHMGFALGEAEFEEGMSSRWETYRQYTGTSYDLSISDLAAAIGPAPPGDPSTQVPTNMLYARGALVSYMLDFELARNGHRLEEALGALYLDALDDRRWTRQRLQEVLLAISGDDFEAFLIEWTDSNAGIPLTGTFELR